MLGWGRGEIDATELLNKLSAVMAKVEIGKEDGERRDLVADSKESTARWRGKLALGRLKKTTSPVKKEVVW